MREIKFRAWDKVKKQMCDVINIDWYYKNTNGPTRLTIESPDQEIVKITLHGIKDFELMQYTGLRDCKRTKEYPVGQPIYEGDIVRQYIGDLDLLGIDNGEIISTVFYADGMFQIKEDGYDSDDLLLLRDYHEEMEVIGNIYDNPELLK